MALCLRLLRTGYRHRGWLLVVLICGYVVLQHCCTLPALTTMPHMRLPAVLRFRPENFTSKQLSDIKLRLRSLEGLFPGHIDTDKSLGMNADLSNKLGLYREVPMAVLPECKQIVYDTRAMPTVSVVISFHNEAWSTILRTVTSVFFRTPPHLLEEIILVDDASTIESSIGPLDAIIIAIPKAKLIRNSDRQGLIRTRMNGARAARGDVLIFLDAHVEVTEVWVEPLLQAIQKDPTTILSPAIDTIDYETLRYNAVPDTQYSGSFTWKYLYIWKELPHHFNSLRKSKADPLYTATFVACAIAVDRRHFFSMGAFDEGMMIWGGENLEISFRYWMCAGGVQIIPCSKIGHVYRKYLPYSIPGTGVLEKNYQRAADVWMDEYGKFYYAAIHKRFAYSPAEQVSLEARLALRRRLQCRSFQWYLDTVMPEMFVPWENATFQGQMVALVNRYCASVDPNTGYLEVTTCQHDPHQYFYFTKDRRLFHNSSHCAVVEGPDQLVAMRPCRVDAAPDQLWEATRDILLEIRNEAGEPAKSSDSLTRLEYGLGNVKDCLTQITASNKQMVGLKPCDKKEKYAHWDWSYRMDMSVFDKPPIEPRP